MCPYAPLGSLCAMASREGMSHVGLRHASHSHLNSKCSCKGKGIPLAAAVVLSVCWGADPEVRVLLEAELLCESRVAGGVLR